ncbi:universal stress protein [Streptomyces sp. NPDC058735]|uniref:universal stress protein n=1 Tax=unclassified Streptomyces TaxID=2593676 RepID=UPI0036CDADBC
MSRTIMVGLDGSPESRAAAEWAAREATLRHVPVRLVHVWEPAPAHLAQAPLLGPETVQEWTEWIPREAAEGLALRHPGVDVTTVHKGGRPADVLADAARDAELLVLGSRGLGGIAGFVVGSVGQAVVARAEAPVILVRAGEQAADEHAMDPSGIPSAATAFRPVLLGLDTRSHDDAVVSFAFEEAARRDTPLRVLHAWNLPPYNIYGLSDGVNLYDELVRAHAEELTDVLGPWRNKYPGVEVVEESRCGSPASHLVKGAREASLIVVGRRIRHSPLGAHIGAVAHAVMHHAAAPVAVVAHP